MKLDKLTGTDGFVVIDLDDATTSVGIARLAPKVLREGVELLARSVTYAFASFGIAGHGGASAASTPSPRPATTRSPPSWTSCGSRPRPAPGAGARVPGSAPPTWPRWAGATPTRPSPPRALWPRPG